MTLQDYIQKDIERKEGMKYDDPRIKAHNLHPTQDWTKCEVCRENGTHNKVLQALIDIKRKELEELNEHDT